MDANTRIQRDEDRLEALLVQADRRGPEGLRFDDLRELAQLYRSAASRLARLRHHADDPERIRRLNALCVRAFTHLGADSAEPEPAREAWGARLARALAATWRPQALAWLLLALGVFLGAALGARDPAAVHAFVPASLGYSAGRLDQLIHSPEAREAFLEREATSVTQKAAFGSFLFANNTRVGLLSFATGMLAGIPPLLLQVYNGLMVGALAVVFFADGLPIGFLAWILPHGIPEFTAITLCCAAGLVLGRAVALPGRSTRRAALARAIDPALLLVAGSIPLFVLAALIESFVRESTWGNGPRLAVAGLMALGAVGVAAWSRHAARRVPRGESFVRRVIPAPEARDSDRARGL